MTSFSLFHQPSFRAKIQGIRNPLHLKALYASMFAFSARFASPSPDRSHPLPTSCGHGGSQRFLKLAKSFTEQALDECEDDMPPLVLLQAMVLTTYHQLTAGVRGRAWRSLIAYETKLHLIDYEAHKDAPTQADIHRWSANEEKRRCWWAIWEMDVFASTIRRSPTTVDWAMNQTYLPVDDQLWFSNQYQSSCFLELEPANRWKELKQCGNESPVAWFIVINSLMRNAQALIRGNLSGILCNKETSEHLFILRQYFENSVRKKYSSEDTKQQAILDSLRCTISVLPEHLAYRGECLDFAANAPAVPLTDLTCITTKDARRLHAAKYGIYLMTQQARFMIYHHDSFDEVMAGTIFPTARTNRTSNWTADIHTDSPKCKGLRKCLEAADNILDIVKNSAHCHVQWVNPFFASTVWLAASMQILSKVFEPDSDMNLIETKCEILRLTCEKYLEFWGTPIELLDNLNALEERLLEKRREDPIAVDLNKSRKGHGDEPSRLSETSGQTDHERNFDGPSKAQPLLTQDCSTPNMEESTQPLCDDASAYKLLIPAEPIPNTEWMNMTLGSGNMMHWSLERHSPCDDIEVVPAPTINLDITKSYEPNSIGNSDFTWFS
ncbi:unnamed protein product [Clonostachys rosea]|uniref:Xylanolytic transcriptional activator regulatory domain-containing protein n=1 Tax=Bionectria ochroleuca TaxID=29856 RepID=A0ABY6U8Y7_BIOOC|nr:unnamed protein product [Clonostachys rosea]